MGISKQYPNRQPLINRLGFSALWLIFIVVAMVIGIYLVQTQTNLTPQASKAQKYHLAFYPSANLIAQFVSLNPKQSAVNAYVLLKDSRNITLINQRNYIYIWSIDDPTIATITPYTICNIQITDNLVPVNNFSPRPNILGCPKNFIQITPTALGKTSIKVTVFTENSKKLLAEGLFTLEVTTDLPPQSCTSDLDCTTNQICSPQMCTSPSPTACPKRKVCPTPKPCLENRVCLPKSSPTPSPLIVCAQDLKMCPDGSYVRREPPTCNFAACP